MKRAEKDATNRSSSRPTSEDVAREAGFSQTTVSYVLSGSKHSNRISSETKLRILAAARRLGYSRNSIGTALRRGYSDTLVVLAVSWELATAHSQTIMSVSRTAAARQLSTTVQIAGDDTEAMSFLNNIHSNNPFGLLLLWDSVAMPTEYLRLVREDGLPIIDLLPSGTEHVISITADRRQGMSAATKYLIELGHRRIGFIARAASKWGASREKLLGYEQELAEAQIDFQESLVEETRVTGFEAGHDAIRKLMNRRPDTTAVICMDDTVAIGALSAAENLGLKIPEQLSIVGHGASREGTYVKPTLTTLGVPTKMITEEAVDMLIQMRNNKDFKAATHYQPMELIVRESTGPVRS